MPTEKARVMVTIHDPQVGPTIGRELNGLSLAGVLGRYADLVERGARDLEAVLERAEWNAIADANNGCADMWDYTDGPPATPPLLMFWANVHDTPGLGEKWGIDQKRLVKKLQGLAPHHGEAILAAVRFFWDHCEPGEINHQKDEWWTPEFRRQNTKKE
jgi:hypothetical protein